MKRITVFCGSSSGYEQSYVKAAKEVGETLARHDIELVYGGAKVGIMGAVANGVLHEGGRVIGVLPRFLMKKEITHEKITELILVDSMHERKAKMSELSDGFIALPGGFGTLDELFEIMTWAQLGLHKKPVALLNVAGFYDALVMQMQVMAGKGLLKEANRQMLLIGDHIEGLLSMMNGYVAPAVGKWITPQAV